MLQKNRAAWLLGHGYHARKLSVVGQYLLAKNLCQSELHARNQHGNSNRAPRVSMRFFFAERLISPNAPAAGNSIESKCGTCSFRNWQGKKTGCERSWTRGEVNQPVHRRDRHRTTNKIILLFFFRNIGCSWVGCDQTRGTNSGQSLQPASEKMISTGKLAAPGTPSTVKLAKLGAADSAGEGNDMRSENHSVVLCSMID